MNRVHLLRPVVPLRICTRPIIQQRSRNLASRSLAQPRFKVGYVFSFLAFAGLSATSYGLYLYYSGLSTWPSAVRSPLRAAIRAEQQEAYEYAERFFRDAVQAAVAAPESGSESLGKDSQAKLSGLFAAFGAMLEKANKPEEAAEIYQQAFDSLVDVQGPLLLRKVGIAQKLGELAAASGSPESLRKAEEHYDWSVSTLLRAASSESQRLTAEAQAAVGQPGLSVEELEMPSWMSNLDLGASLENLGNLYLEQGRADYAIQLFGQVLKLLLPKKLPGVPTPTYQDRCHSGTVSNNLASAYALQPTRENLKEAQRWAAQAVHIASHSMQEAAKDGKSDQVGECGPCLAVGQFNLGLLAEMQKDKQAAAKYFVESLESARRFKFVEGARQASTALQRLRTSTG